MDVVVEDQHGKLYKLDSPWINENWKYDEQSETLWDVANTMGRF